MNQAVEKFRCWLLEHYRSYQDELVNLFTSEKGTNNVCVRVNLLESKDIAFQIAVYLCQKGGYAEEKAVPQFDQDYYIKIVSKLLTFQAIPDPILARLKEVHCRCLSLHRRNI